MSNILDYKGYYARVEFSAEDNVLFGKIEGINDLVTFEATDLAKVEEEFHSAVDDYLDYCKQLGQSPDKTYSGTFNIRVNPEVHKQLANIAIRRDTSLNRVVEDAFIKYLENDSIAEKVDTMWSNFSDPSNYMFGSASVSDYYPFPRIIIGGVANG